MDCQFYCCSEQRAARLRWHAPGRAASTTETPARDFHHERRIALAGCLPRSRPERDVQSARARGRGFSCSKSVQVGPAGLFCDHVKEKPVGNEFPGDPLAPGDGYRALLTHDADGLVAWKAFLAAYVDTRASAHPQAAVGPRAWL